MSNIVVKERTSFLPATQAKAFKPLNVPQVIQSLFPFPNEERATPSMVKMTKSSALTAIGGKVSASGFINGMLYLLAAHSWGQGKVTDIIKGLPAYSVEALKHGAAFLPAGKGCDALALRSATEEAIFHMLALPAKTKEKVVAPSIAAPVATNEAPRDYMAKDAMLCNPDMDEEQGKRYAGHYLRHVQAVTAARNKDQKYQADCEKADKAEWIAAQSESLAVAATVSREIAAQEFRRLADFLGVNLTKAQLAKLAL